ncbi:MAG: hypothetical protein OJF48_003820 [Afipia sp.]|nr:MAG: hypothetical protein OJF48_003820 [Afipia sp.]
MPMVIRPAESSDCDDLLAMIRDHANYERNEATISRRGLLSLVTGEGARAHIFVASRQGELLGYFSLTIDYSLWRDHIWAHLDCLYVTTNERGKGVGAGLLAEAIAVARRLGADQLEWQTPEWNERGVAFYLREGALSQVKMRFNINL